MMKRSINFFYFSWVLRSRLASLDVSSEPAFSFAYAIGWVQPTRQAVLSFGVLRSAIRDPRSEISSFVPQRNDRIKSRGANGRIKSEEGANERGECGRAERCRNRKRCRETISIHPS